MCVIDHRFLEETTVHHFTAEVSELVHGGQLNGRRGLPRKFSVRGLGNGNPFVVEKIERNEGDLLFVKYRQVLGCVFVTVFND